MFLFYKNYDFLRVLTRYQKNYLHFIFLLLFLIFFSEDKTKYYFGSEQ